MIGGQWQGMAEAMKALDAIVSEVARDEVLEGALLSGVGRPMAEEMRARAPRRAPAPDMADSLAALASTEEREIGTVVVTVGPRKSHPHGYIARFMERGTSRMPAKPFMRPVYDEWQGRITERFVRAIQPVYQRAVARYSRAK